MLFWSTTNPSIRYPLKQVLFDGLAPDGGLFLPCDIPLIPELERPEILSTQELALHLARSYFAPDIPENRLGEIIQEVLSFRIPLKQITEDAAVLELFHGPTAAFKDFGALFLSRVLSWLWRQETRTLTVLVATSGDTGGAVAHGFFGVPGVRVVLLYPQSRVSPLQEQQMTTLGGNIVALEVAGNFDDCQSLVKSAFQDSILRQNLTLTSANSINFGRLLPQSFYYAEAVRLYRNSTQDLAPLVLSVPSGNVGNLTSGVLAKRMGLPISQFLLATNKNRVAANYLHSGVFTPEVSLHTLSNAMDVGNPSNLARLIALFQTHQELTEAISGSSWSDEQTLDAMRRVSQQFGYILDPHTAVGFLALEQYLLQHPESRGIVLGTAHPYKFHEALQTALGHSIPAPPQLTGLKTGEKKATSVRAEYSDIQQFLLALSD